MTDEKLVEIYERIRRNFGSNFTPDFGGYTMQREVDGLVMISLEPPQKGLAPGELTTTLLTTPLRGGTPEELIDKLNALISMRDAVEQKAIPYKGTLRDYDDGIEYVYELPTQDESQLARIVMDFDSI